MSYWLSQSKKILQKIVKQNDTTRTTPSMPYDLLAFSLCGCLFGVFFCLYFVLYGLGFVVCLFVLGVVLFCFFVCLN